MIFYPCALFHHFSYTRLTSIKGYGATCRGCDAIIVGLDGFIRKALFHDFLAALDIYAALRQCDPASADVIDTCIAMGIQIYAVHADILELDEVVGLDARCARDGQIGTIRSKG